MNLTVMRMLSDGASGKRMKVTDLTVVDESDRYAHVIRWCICQANEGYRSHEGHQGRHAIQGMSLTACVCVHMFCFLCSI